MHGVVYSLLKTVYIKIDGLHHNLHRFLSTRSIHHRGSSPKINWLVHLIPSEDFFSYSIEYRVKKRRVSSNKSRVSSYKSRVSSNKSRVSSDESRVSSDKSRVSSYKKRVSSNKKRVSSNKKRVSSNKTDQENDRMQY